jgi:mevalonate kinase
MSAPIGHASGKVILLGEHAVVYGVPAIAVGIDRGATATAVALPSGKSRLRVRAWGVDVAADDPASDLGRAFGALLRASGSPATSLVDAEANLPPGGGLGCSAAIGVAVARAIDPKASDDDILERAMAWERVFHGNPSGIDAAVATLGGSVFFEKAHPIETLSVRSPLVFAVGNTGLASSTRSMVEAVARQKERRPEIVEKAFKGIESLVRNARLAIEGGDRAALGKLMDLNQMLLAGLMVSTEEIERMCDLARESGALGAKLTGAGGGGCVVALTDARTKAEKILSVWRDAGFEGFVAETHATILPTRTVTFPATSGASSP